MKTITLRTLMREPLTVKRLTRTGKSVQVTDSGEPLWILQPANCALVEAERLRATAEILDEVLRDTPSRISAARLAFNKSNVGISKPIMITWRHHKISLAS